MKKKQINQVVSTFQKKYKAAFLGEINSIVKNLYIKDKNISEIHSNALRKKAQGILSEKLKNLYSLLAPKKEDIRSICRSSENSKEKIRNLDRNIWQRFNQGKSEILNDLDTNISKLYQKGLEINREASYWVSEGREYLTPKGLELLSKDIILEQKEYKEKQERITSLIRIIGDIHLERTHRGCVIISNKNRFKKRIGLIESYISSPILSEFSEHIENRQMYMKNDTPDIERHFRLERRLNNENQVNLNKSAYECFTSFLNSKKANLGSILDYLILNRNSLLKYKDSIGPELCKKGFDFSNYRLGGKPLKEGRRSISREFDLPYEIGK